MVTALSTGNLKVYFTIGTFLACTLPQANHLNLRMNYQLVPNTHSIYPFVLHIYTTSAICTHHPSCSMYNK